MKVTYSNFKIDPKKSEPLKAIEQLEVAPYDFSKFNNKTVKRPFKANALGDSIAWCSFVVRMHQQLQCSTVNDLRDKDKRVLEEVFGFDPSGINIGNNDLIGIHRMDCYSIQFAPAVFQWKASNSKTVCYQFETRLRSGLDKQFQNESDKTMVLQTLRDKGYQPIELSADYSLTQCQEFLATSSFFVGICSGMSHLAHCVGTPTHIICNGRSIERVKKHHGINARGPVALHQLPKDFVEALPL